MSTREDLKIGLVLAGGGAKGAYQCGVLKALWDLDLIQYVKVVSGVSIGVMNALALCMKDRELIDLAWRSLSYSKIMTRDGGMKVKELGDFIRQYALQRNKEQEFLKQFDVNELGFISQTGIRNYINKFINIKLLYERNIDVFGCAYHIEAGRPEYFKLNDYTEEEIIDITIASCSIPLVFKPVNFRGNLYADGGFNSSWYSKQNADNVPIKPLLDYECDVILVIHLCHHERLELPFPKNQVIEIYPSSTLETMRGAGTFNFYQGTIQQNMITGYRDGLVVLGPLAANYFQGKALQPLIERQYQRNQNLVWKKYDKKKART